MTSDIEMRMNLAAIKKTDPYAKEIIESSAHVAFYTFNSTLENWEKTDVEGALFIYSRNAEPFQSIFINNRLNTNSFVEPITASLELQPQRPFILYRNERSRIRGFWFYNNDECDRIGEFIRKLIEDCNDRKENISSQTIPASVLNVTNVNNNSGVNLTNCVSGGNDEKNSILNLLTKAQENYNSSQRVSNGNGKSVDHLKMSSQQNQRIPIEPVTPLKLESNQSESVLNFFAKAMPTPTADVPLLQRLNNVNPLSVDQIEKQQRATTPVSTGGVELLQTHSNAVENSFAHLKIGAPQVNDLQNSPLAKFLGTNFVRTPQQQQPQPEIRTSVASMKPALMPPTMFAPTVGGASKNDVSLLSISLGNTLGEPVDKVPDALTQSQLTQAISYLMRNDPAFVRKIHEAYLKSFNDMLSL